jgi:hypothetical protein
MIISGTQVLEIACAIFNFGKGHATSEARVIPLQGA